MDIVFLTPISIEYQVISELLSNLSPRIIDKHVYETGSFRGKHHNYTIAIRETGSKLEDIALATEKSIQHLKPSFIFLLGIAGGVKDVAIGDIVVGTKAYGYEAGKESDDDFLARPESIGFDPDLIEYLRLIARRSNWAEGLNLSPSPKVFFGPIASGNKVIATSKGFVNSLLKKNFNDTIALEMEAIGFAKALARSPGVRALNIRGISDLLAGKGESDKAGGQERAMRNLLAFVRAFLYDLNFPDYKIVAMNPRELAGVILDKIFPHLALVSPSNKEVNLAPDAPDYLQKIWQDVASIISEEVTAEDSLADAKITARSSLRKQLGVDDALLARLSQQVEMMKKNDHSGEVKIINNKNIIKDSKITVGGDFHLGDNN